MSLNPYESPQALLLDRAEQPPAPPNLRELSKRAAVAVVAGLIGAAILFALVRIAILCGFGPSQGAIIVPGSMSVAVVVAACIGHCTARSERWWRWVEAQVLIVILMTLFNLLAPAISVPRTPPRKLPNPNSLKPGNVRESPAGVSGQKS